MFLLENKEIGDKETNSPGTGLTPLGSETLMYFVKRMFCSAWYQSPRTTVGVGGAVTSSTCVLSRPGKHDQVMLRTSITYQMGPRRRWCCYQLHMWEVGGPEMLVVQCMCDVAPSRIQIPLMTKPIKLHVTGA